jgi:hypothetical protein
MTFNIFNKNILISVALIVFFNVNPAWGHAFGGRYDLPLPLWLILIGAASAVILSFCIMALFLKHRGEAEEALYLDLLKFPGIAWLSSEFSLNCVRFLSVSIFLLTIFTGIYGDPGTLKNFAPTFVWVIWWNGMAFASALVGNLWSLVNPWKIIFVWFEKITGGIGPIYIYPSILARWPAVLLFGIFAWLELISDLGEDPRALAWLIILYSILTWFGMTLFGRQAWLRNADPFSSVFDLLARFAPSIGIAKRWLLRLPAVGLLDKRPVTFSGVCFVLLLLTTVTFDGILETPLWANLMESVSSVWNLTIFPSSIQNSSLDPIVISKVLALIILPCIFIAIYMAFSLAIAAFGGGYISTLDVAGYFVLSLVPIAIAYHLSHYLSYMLITGQNIIPLLSDPFGFGWDLFGTVGYKVDIGIVTAKQVWYMGVAAIVIGHVIAVYVAHIMAIRVFAERLAALKSQVPMLVLMIGYTMVSLWVLSQPIVD